jgi:hypothetical protein
MDLPWVSGGRAVTFLGRAEAATATEMRMMRGRERGKEYEGRRERKI